MHPPTSQSSKLSLEAQDHVVKAEKDEDAVPTSSNQETSDAEKKLVRKIDLYLMSTLWVLYLFSYMDRTNIGNAKVAGMMEDLNLTSNDYSVAILVFIIAYVVFEVPSNMLLTRIRASISVPTIMFLWRAVGAIMGGVQNAGQLWAARFMLGVFESGFSPAVLVIVSTWYKKSEQTKRFMCYLTAGILSGAFAGLLAGAIAKGLDGAHGIAGWRWLFIVEGVLTCGVALVAPFCLLDSPRTARQLTPEERELASSRVLADGINHQAEGEQSISRRRALVAVFTDPRVYLLAVAYQSVVGVLGSLSYFVPSLVKTMGYETVVSAQLMSAPLYVVALVVAVPVAVLGDYIHNYRPFVIATVLLLGTLFCGLSAGILAHIPRYVLLCLITAMTWTANPLAVSYFSSALGGEHPEFRAIALAFINGSGNIATIYASYMFPVEDSPRYLKGYIVYGALMALGAGLYCFSFVWLRRKPFQAY